MARILDVIEYPNPSPNEIVHRVPESGPGDFRIGSQLIVREGQVAVFFRDGKALDAFGPGRHTITTANIPLLTGLVSAVFSGDTPFTAEVYFVSTRDFIDQRWGTPEPITLRDEVLRMVRIRAHGTYNMQVADPQLFVAQVMGTRGYMSTQDVSNYLRSIIITRITDLLGQNMRTVLDLPAMYDEIAAATRVRVRDDFASMGLLLKQLYIMSVSPTEETSAAIDEAASMGAIGNMDSYLKFKAARAVGDSAAAGGGAGEGTQLGMGLGTGLAMAKILSEGLSGQQAAPAPQAAPAADTAPSAAGGAAGAAASDPVVVLTKLKEMLDAGLISQAEYDSKKAEILSRL
ncbi:MAG TPA: SPFH domain-containing protein [Chloroflexi bacterium]|jgi:membrane protease subunit (stomatin/prohibitin family)|nr:SPFH domain-containing protein [Chloroflexota bacterium]